MHTDDQWRRASRGALDIRVGRRQVDPVRLGLAAVPTTTEVEDQLDRLTSAVERMAARLDELANRLDAADGTAGDTGA